MEAAEVLIPLSPCWEPAAGEDGNCTSVRQHVSSPHSQLSLSHSGRAPTLLSGDRASVAAENQTIPQRFVPQCEANSFPGAAGTHCDPGVHPEEGKYFLSEMGCENEEWGLSKQIIKCHSPPFILQENPNSPEALTQGQRGLSRGEGPVLAPALIHSPNALLRAKGEPPLPAHRLCGYSHTPSCSASDIYFPVMLP